MTLRFRVPEGGTLIDTDSSHSSDRQALDLSPCSVRFVHETCHIVVSDFVTFQFIEMSFQSVLVK
jgi:hypothetical protein